MFKNAGGTAKGRAGFVPGVQELKMQLAVGGSPGGEGDGCLLVLVRHGTAIAASQRTAAQRHDPPLAERGHQEAAAAAAALAQVLARRGLRAGAARARLWSSPMQRALHTAKPIAEQLGLTAWACHGALYEFGAAISGVRCVDIAATAELQGVVCEHFDPSGAACRLCGCVCTHTHRRQHTPARNLLTTASNST